MKWIDNLKTSVKLFGDFGIVVVFMLAAAGVGCTAMNTINNGIITRK